jgi:hypothetical protein
MKFSALWGNAFVPPRVAFHKIGVGGRDGVVEDSTGLRLVKMRMAHLGSVMKRLGHHFVNVLTIDIEGSEWQVLDDIFGGGIVTAKQQEPRHADVPLIRHILVEVHLTPRISPGRTPGDVLKMHEARCIPATGIGRCDSKSCPQSTTCAAISTSSATYIDCDGMRVGPRVR